MLNSASEYEPVALGEAGAADGTPVNGPDAAMGPSAPSAAAAEAAAIAAGSRDLIAAAPRVTERTLRRSFPNRRHVVDRWRLGLGLTVVAITALLAHRDVPTVVEINLFRLVNELPASLTPPFQGVMQLGSLVAVPVLAMAALVFRRRRLAEAVAAAGAAAWGAAKVLQYVTDEEPPLVRLSRVLLHGSKTAGLAFPASHVAVVAAMVTASSNYVSRPTRRLMWTIVVVIALARMYVGAHLPVDVVGGVALGWSVGALASLILGTPPLLPDELQLLALVRSRYGDAVELRALPGATSARARYLITPPDGDREVLSIVGRDDPGQDWLVRLGQIIAFRDVAEQTIARSPNHRVDREAHVLLLAQRGGVRVAPLTGTYRWGESWSGLSRQWIDGTPVDRLKADAVTDDELADLFDQVKAFHDLGLAHGSLRGDHLILDPSRHVWLTSLRLSTVDAGREAEVADLVEVSASLAVNLGASRIASIVRGAFPEDTVSHIVIGLQPLALTRGTRLRLARDPGCLDRLRAELSQGRTVDEPVRSPVRVALGNLLPLALVAAAVFTLLPRLSELPAVTQLMTRASPGWLVAALLAYAATYAASTMAIQAVSPRPLNAVRTLVVQLGATFLNRVSPANLGATATNIAYLRKSGGELSEATGSVLSLSVIGAVAHVVLTVVAVATVASGKGSITPVRFPSWLPYAALIAVAAVLIGVGRGQRGLRRLAGLVPHPIRQGFASLKSIFAEPRRVVLALIGSAGVTIGHLLAFVACVYAFGGHISVAKITIVFLVGSTVGSAAAVPGGLGAFEASAVATFSRFGMPVAPALSATLSYRLLTYWLPILPGFVAWRSLRRQEIL